MQYVGSVLEEVYHVGHSLAWMLWKSAILVQTDAGVSEYLLIEMKHALARRRKN